MYRRSPRRSTGELSILIFVGLIPLCILALLVWALAPARVPAQNPPGNTPDIFLGNKVPSPVIVKVYNNYIVPAATPSPTATPSLSYGMMPTSASPNYCDPAFTQDGAVCEWPAPAPPTPTPYPTCLQPGQPTPEPGDRCRWVTPPTPSLNLWG